MMRVSGAPPALHLAAPYVLLTLTMTFWASNSVIGRVATSHMPPTALAFWAWVTAFAVMTPWTLPRLIRHRRVLARAWPILAILGILGIGMFQSILYLALSLTNSINVAILNTPTPVIIAALSWVFFRTPITGRTAAGMAAAFVGVIAVIARGDLAVLRGLDFSRGDLVMVCGALVWSAYSLLLRFRPPELDPTTFLAAIIPWGLLVSGTLYWSGWLYPWRFTVGSETLTFLAYAGVFPTAMAYTMYAAGTRALGPHVAGQFLYLPPIITAILAVNFLGESFAAYHIRGLVLIVGGLYVSTVRRREGKG
jgi:drug/metabolite transporter (DMT)-like permease